MLKDQNEDNPGKCDIVTQDLEECEGVIELKMLVIKSDSTEIGPSAQFTHANLHHLH